MSFRQTYSRFDNDPLSQAESSLEMVIMINNLRMGRIQGLRYSGNAAPRPVTEIGTDRRVEFVPGIKTYQGSIQAITITYGDLLKRISSVTGTPVDPASKAATLSNFPEFDIVITRRGLPSYNNPALYAPPQSEQPLAGSGGMSKTLVGCVITSFEGSINVNEALLMESVSFEFIDIMEDAQDFKGGNQLFSGFPTTFSGAA